MRKIYCKSCRYIDTNNSGEHYCKASKILCGLKDTPFEQVPIYQYLFISTKNKNNDCKDYKIDLFNFLSFQKQPAGGGGVANGQV